MPALVQLCMGIPWGAPDDLNTLMAVSYTHLTLPTT